MAKSKFQTCAALIIGSLILLTVLPAAVKAQSLKLFGDVNCSKYTFNPQAYQGIDWDTGVTFRTASSERRGYGAGVGIEILLLRPVILEVDAFLCPEGLQIQTASR